MGIILTEEILEEMEINDYIDSILDEEDVLSLDESRLEGGRPVKVCNDGKNNKIPTLKGLYVMVGLSGYHNNPRIKVTNNRGTNFNKNGAYTEVFMDIDDSGDASIRIKGRLTLKDSEMSDVERFMIRNKNIFIDNNKGDISDKELAKRLVKAEIKYFSNGGK